MEPTPSPEKLRMVRQLLSLDQEAFGAGIGVSKAAISRWETGAAEITLLAALAMEHVYGISREWLLSGHGEAWIANPPSSPSYRPPTGVVLVPAFDGIPVFEGRDEVPDPNAAKAFYRFRSSMITILLERCRFGTPETLCLVKIPDDESMAPILTPGGLAMVNTCLELRGAPPEGALMLANINGRACFRRFFAQAPQEPEREWKYLLQTDRPSDKATFEPAPNGELEKLILGMVVI